MADILDDLQGDSILYNPIIIRTVVLGLSRSGNFVTKANGAGIVLVWSSPSEEDIVVVEVRWS